ncbi:hypothetical protein EBZ37_15060, partial [bacterium]|nr:hypothetical protein [bacterium]
MLRCKGLLHLLREQSDALHAQRGQERGRLRIKSASFPNDELSPVSSLKGRPQLDDLIEQAAGPQTEETHWAQTHEFGQVLHEA